jgi:sRNA-binding regulator protein Hfq
VTDFHISTALEVQDTNIENIRVKESKVKMLQFNTIQIAGKITIKIPVQ